MPGTLPWLTCTAEAFRQKWGDVFEGEIEYDAEELLREGDVVTNAHYSFPIEGLPTVQLYL